MSHNTKAICLLATEGKGCTHTCGHGFRPHMVASWILNCLKTTAPHEWSMVNATYGASTAEGSLRPSTAPCNVYDRSMMTGFEEI